MVRNYSEIGYKLGQKRVRAVVIQLCGFLQKLESVLTFHFYCECKKPQDKVFQLIKNKLMNSMEWQTGFFLIVSVFNQWVNFLYSRLEIEILYWNFNS